MTVQERLDLLQAVLEEEQSRLALPHLELLSQDIEEDEVLAHYSRTQDGQAVITIDLEYLAVCSSQRALTSLCHEARHAYQYYTVSLIDWDDPAIAASPYFATARNWKGNFEGYTSGLDDYAGYFTQSIELDARDYADRRAEYYLYILETGIRPASPPQGEAAG